MRVVYCFVVSIVFMSIFACHRSSFRKELGDFLGSEVRIPQNMRAFVEGRDTSINSEIYQRGLKLVVWYDSTGCSSCRLKTLRDWEIYLDYLNLKKINLLIIISPSIKDIHNVNIGIKSQRFPFVVYKDYAQEMYALNSNMPNNPELHTFLLDENNRVVLAGNPLNNLALSVLYDSLIISLSKNGGLLDNL